MYECFRDSLQDRQESAERKAQELADKLRVMELEKESLELRNQQLERSLQQLAPQASSKPLQEYVRT